jgi:hypothetical protein
MCAIYAFHVKPVHDLHVKLSLLIYRRQWPADIQKMRTSGRISKAKTKPDSQSKISTLFKSKSSSVSIGDAKKKQIQPVKETPVVKPVELEAVEEDQEEDLPQENKDRILSEFKSFDLNQKVISSPYLKLQ